MIFDTSIVIVLIIMAIFAMIIIPILYILDKKIDDLEDIFWQNYWKEEKENEN